MRWLLSVSLCLAVLSVVASHGRHRHDHSHSVDSDDFTRHHVLRSACRVLDGDGEVITSRPCPGNVTCTMGPLEGIHLRSENRDVTAFFCNISFAHHMSRRGPCRVENTEGVVIRQRECRRGVLCDLGPRTFTFAGQEVVAFFCNRRLPAPRGRRHGRN